MDNYLVVCALGTDKTGLVEEFAKISAENRCNIEDSRMLVMGCEFSLSMMISGTWDAIAKLEAQLPVFAKKLDLNVISKRTQLRPALKNAMPFYVNVVALDNPGIVHEIANFFARQGINIETMETNTYAAPHTGSAMFSLTMTINIPGRINIATLRETFMVFCDDRNLDSYIEHFKNPTPGGM